MDETWKTIGAIAAPIVTVGGLLYWHFKTFYGLKDEINDLKVKVAELKGKDDLQQGTIDRLTELYPALNNVIALLSNKKGK